MTRKSHHARPRAARGKGAGCPCCGRLRCARGGAARQVVVIAQRALGTGYRKGAHTGSKSGNKCPQGTGYSGALCVCRPRAALARALRLAEHQGARLCPRSGAEGGRWRGEGAGCQLQAAVAGQLCGAGRAAAVPGLKGVGGGAAERVRRQPHLCHSRLSASGAESEGRRLQEAGAAACSGAQAARGQGSGCSRAGGRPCRRRAARLVKDGAAGRGHQLVGHQEGGAVRQAQHLLGAPCARSCFQGVRPQLSSPTAACDGPYVQRT